MAGEGQLGHGRGRRDAGLRITATVADLVCVAGEMDGAEPVGGIELDTLTAVRPCPPYCNPPQLNFIDSHSVNVFGSSFVSAILRTQVQ